MYEILTDNLKKLAKACPFPLYAVGGRVRDYIAGFTPDETDTDLCARYGGRIFEIRKRERFYGDGGI